MKCLWTLISVVTFTFGVGCGSSKPAPANNPAGTNKVAACATVPSGATVNGTTYDPATGHCMTETSGKWTALTVHMPLNGGAITLNATCDDVAPFASQADFNASEGATGTDYVVTATCASGSVTNSTNKELFIWKKNP